MRRVIQNNIYEKVDSNYEIILFRKKYNLLPNDPRLLELTDLEIYEDLLTDDAFKKITIEAENQKPENLVDTEADDWFNSKEGYGYDK